jgi:hypothetical protein
MSANFGPSYKAVASIPSYRFVEVDATSAKNAFVIKLVATTTTTPLGISQDTMLTNGSAEIAQAGQARLQAGASVTAGDLLGPQSATGKGITYTEGTTTAMVARWKALHAGSTNSVIKVVHV